MKLNVILLLRGWCAGERDRHASQMAQRDRSGYLSHVKAISSPIVCK